MMKQALIGTLLAVTVGTASALDVTVSANRDLTGHRNGGGIAVSQNAGPLTLSVGADRFDYKKGNVDMYSVTVGYEVAKVMGVSVSPQLGLAYNDVEFGRNGWGLQPGLAFSVPVTKSVALVADYRRQYGEDKIKSMNTNAISVGVKVGF